MPGNKEGKDRSTILSHADGQGDEIESSGNPLNNLENGKVMAITAGN